MHSSRMRTVRSSGRISGGMYLVQGGCTWSGGVCTWSQGGVPGLGGCVTAPEGGCSWPRGYTYSRGGVFAPGGCLLPVGCTWSGTPPCGQTDACKNITFATSLRTVKILTSYEGFVKYLLTHNQFLNLDFDGYIEPKS